MEINNNDKLNKENVYFNLGLIVAMGQNREIGQNNNLIWKIKEDLNFFKNVTMNSYIIMGRNTYDSMPKNLSGRKYIVLSRNNDFILDSTKMVHRNIEETLEFVKKNNTVNFWVIGGGKIYTSFLPFVNTMHITKIEDSYKDADTFFPKFNIEEWDENIGELKYSENNIKYRHILLKKR